MEASREFSRTPPHLPPCSDVSVLQKTRMSHFWDTHHTTAVLRKFSHSICYKIAFRIGLCGVVEADLELFCNCWSAGIFGERL